MLQPHIFRIDCQLFHIVSMYNHVISCRHHYHPTLQIYISTSSGALRNAEELQTHGKRPSNVSTDLSTWCLILAVYRWKTVENPIINRPPVRQSSPAIAKFWKIGDSRLLLLVACSTGVLCINKNEGDKLLVSPWNQAFLYDQKLNLNNQQTNMVGGWPTPLKNDEVRQLGSWNSQYMEKIIQMFQTTNQKHKNRCVSLWCSWNLGNFTEAAHQRHARSRDSRSQWLWIRDSAQVRVIPVIPLKHGWNPWRKWHLTWWWFSYFSWESTTGITW